MYRYSYALFIIHLNVHLLTNPTSLQLCKFIIFYFRSNFTIKISYLKIKQNCNIKYSNTIVQLCKMNAIKLHQT